jgi:hypothetical protein
MRIDRTVFPHDAGSGIWLLLLLQFLAQLAIHVQWYHMSHPSTITNVEIST